RCPASPGTAVAASQSASRTWSAVPLVWRGWRGFIGWYRSGNGEDLRGSGTGARSRQITARSPVKPGNMGGWSRWFAWPTGRSGSSMGSFWEEVFPGIGDGVHLVRVTVRLLTAVVLGGIIGFEREHAGKQ